MNRQLLIFTALLGGVLASQAAPPPGKGYAPVLVDEFNGTKLDTTRWSYNYPWGTTHNHQANMQPSQVTVTNGVLTVTAIAKHTAASSGYWDNGFNKWIPFAYTSGAIHTNGKERFHKGYFEGRFKLPNPVSTWPAFWMLQDGWPPENDILEVQGDRTRYCYNYHYGSDWQHHQSFGGTVLRTRPEHRLAHLRPGMDRQRDGLLFR